MTADTDCLNKEELLYLPVIYEYILNNVPLKISEFIDLHSMPGIAGHPNIFQNP